MRKLIVLVLVEVLTENWVRVCFYVLLITYINYIVCVGNTLLSTHVYVFVCVCLYERPIKDRYKLGPI